MLRSADVAPLLELKAVSLSFGGVQALKDVSFNVKMGEICAVIGPNGAGKSSLLNIINGVYCPSRGTIAFDGALRKRMNPRQAATLGIARTFQHISLFRSMSVLENIICGCNLRMESSFFEQALWLGRPRREELKYRAEVEEIIWFLQLESVRETPVSALPYGVQKRVELGRALAADPKLLLLDEPMAGMNADEKIDLSCHILEVNRDFGTTIVLIEHDMGVVMDISDHVVVLDYGRKIADGIPNEISSNAAVIEAYLGVDGTDDELGW